MSAIEDAMNRRGRISYSGGCDSDDTGDDFEAPKEPLETDCELCGQRNVCVYQQHPSDYREDDGKHWICEECRMEAGMDR